MSTVGPIPESASSDQPTTGRPQGNRRRWPPMTQFAHMRLLIVDDDARHASCSSMRLRRPGTPTSSAPAIRVARISCAPPSNQTSYCSIWICPELADQVIERGSGSDRPPENLPVLVLTADTHARRPPPRSRDGRSRLRHQADRPDRAAAPRAQRSADPAAPTGARGRNALIGELSPSCSRDRPRANERAGERATGEPHRPRIDRRVPRRRHLPAHPACRGSAPR